ncbi:MAG: outer membrane beta-barrel protein [Hydrogenophaga sp.]|uniref:outer membrane beta-barrel protein n=1 Tax=Hydrogenophaga intermedia TaxID=65786 RepID=UPI002043B474|nr:outer membrane beta-barrel protein [Hydrogenophaga intermedia]MCM3564092.1 porin family protein [Hydrogenophaga intermedia]
MQRARALVLILAASAMSVIATSAHAQHFTLEAAAGNSKYSESGQTLPDSATALGITGRYTWPSGFGVEGGVRGHGEFVATSSSGDTLRLDFTSYLVGVTYDLPLGPVTLGVRLGGHAWRGRGNVIGSGSVWLGKVEDSGTGLYHSLSVSYALTERLSLGVARSEFRLEDGGKLKSTDIRLAYRF